MGEKWARSDDETTRAEGHSGYRTSSMESRSARQILRRSPVPCAAGASPLPLRRRTIMLDAAIKALAQMGTPPFRAVLLKSSALALALIVLVGIALHRLLVWLGSFGTEWGESVLGIGAHTPLV